MYKKHKIVIAVTSIMVFIVSYLFKCDYKALASDSITIISISLAIYMTSFSGLISSDLAKEMKNKSDGQMPWKSELGVLKGYIFSAVVAAIISIAVACIILVVNDRIDSAIRPGKLYYALSSLGFCSLSVNFCFMFFLFKFMTNRQLWSK